MAIIAMFSAAHADGDKIAQALAQHTGWELIEQELLSKAVARFGSKPTDYIRAMQGPAFLFNKFTHKREQHLAWLKATLADLLADKQILHGFAAHLIPRDINHVLRVCILADPEWRAQKLAESKGISKDKARAEIRERDQKRGQWTQRLFRANPWDQTLYDLKIPTHEMGQAEAVALIAENADKDVLAFGAASEQALGDFRLSAACELKLVEAGLYHAVACSKGVATVTVDEYTLRMEKLEREINDALKTVEGISEVKIKTGPNYRPVSILADADFDLPEKVLLVDDEKDFVMTLSERLEMRDLEPAVAYSGEEALSLLEEEEPDVMVLDLKMPGIDGIEVLRRVKAEHPGVEVIVLTGHGSDKDRELCMDLGAFAYLEKPVDINVLSDTMKRAKEAIAEKREK